MRSGTAGSSFARLRGLSPSGWLPGGFIASEAVFCMGGPPLTVCASPGVPGRATVATARRYVHPQPGAPPSRGACPGKTWKKQQFPRLVAQPEELERIAFCISGRRLAGHLPGYTVYSVLWVAIPLAALPAYSVYHRRTRVVNGIIFQSPVVSVTGGFFFEPWASARFAHLERDILPGRQYVPRAALPDRFAAAFHDSPFFRQYSTRRGPAAPAGRRPCFLH